MSESEAAATVAPAFPSGADWDDHRRALADALGLAELVSDTVLTAALGNELYAQRLLAARRAPAILRLLLDHPPAPLEGGMSGLRLLGKAAAAFARWAGQGFASAEPAVLARRRAACCVCEHARLPPKTALYAISGQLDEAICGLCGCNLANKTRLPGEACPGPDPDHPGRSRWGEPLPPTAAARPAPAAAAGAP